MLILAALSRIVDIHDICFLLRVYDDGILRLNCSLRIVSVHRGVLQ